MCTINHVKFGGDHTGIGRESGAAAHAPGGHRRSLPMTGVW